MNIIEVPITRLTEAHWNANTMDVAMRSRLRESITRFGLVGNLVVRPLPDGLHEVLSGNQRLGVLTEMGYTHVSCVIVEVNDAEARLLSQALNHMQGDDDLGLKAEAVRTILAGLPESEVLKILPETPNSLHELAEFGQQDLAEQLRSWQQAQAARLKHLGFQLTQSQLEVIEEALSRVPPLARRNMGDSPNARGTDLYELCKAYLEFGVVTT